jgi:hypothetical protein
VNSHCKTKILLKCLGNIDLNIDLNNCLFFPIYVHRILPSVGLALGSGAIGMGSMLLAVMFIPAGIIQPVLEPDSEGTNKQSLQLHGKLDVLLYDDLGYLKDERHFDNLIVDTGFEGVAYRIAPHDGSVTPSDPWNFIAIGTGNTAPALGDTALVSELDRKNDIQAEYTTTSGKQLKLQVSFGPGEGTGNIAESGMFNAGSGGDMLARQTFAAISKGASDTLTVTWTITLSST